MICADLEFVKTFLYTYQSFATPQRLLRKLIERYNVVRPSGMSFKSFAVMKQTIQARVINAFKLWVDLSVDFKGVCVGREEMGGGGEWREVRRERGREVEARREGEREREI